MILAVDAQYQKDGSGHVAGVLFKDVVDAEPLFSGSIQLYHVAPYEPGQFYKRELPGILQMFHMIHERYSDISLIVIDGYVDLGLDHPGLGRHLFHALGGMVPVLGVAKTQFKDAPALEVVRGFSKKPLFVTSAGLILGADAALVRLMHGTYRIPTMLKLVDHKARQGLK